MDLVAPYWERPAGPTWWCHVAAGHTSVQAWLNNAKWLHPAKPEREIKRNGREQQRRRKRSQSRSRTVVIYIRKLLSAPTIAVHSSKYGQQECSGIFLQLRDQVLPPNLDIYCAFFCDPASNMGSREVSLVMEGSLIRSAIGDHWDFNKFLAFSCKPLWDVILYMVSNVPLPTPGKDMVLFAIEKCVLSVDAPPKDVLPHVEPLVQCLDVDNFLKLLTAVLHERRILLHSNKYLSEPCRDNSCLREVFTFNPSIKGHMSFDLSL
ncbi:hypothetical protein OIU84_021829 [Salix udensis]|uniref:cDENN domain-containing protein n=1 Tax=Salix udensis TaxID=889485 RepID=A0AAD6KW23_9ROSI|nr:hypothetical protein OIU84_021829 [Salix udensis]